MAISDVVNESFYIQTPKVILELVIMTTSKLDIDQLCKDSGNKTPEEILIPLSNGQDPRRVSLVYQKIQQIEDEYGTEPPDEWDWLDLVEMIKAECRSGIVPIKESAAAAKALMEYKHPKRKSVENVDVNPVSNSKELTEKEIKILKKEFDLDF